MVRTAHWISFASFVIGISLAFKMKMDIVTNAYPWADHMPWVALAIGGIAALLCLRAASLFQSSEGDDNASR